MTMPTDTCVHCSEFRGYNKLVIKDHVAMSLTETTQRIACKYFSDYPLCTWDKRANSGQQWDKDHPKHYHWLWTVTI